MPFPSAGWLVLLLVVHASPFQQGPTIVIEGLDPVRLIAGEEVPGKLEIDVDHGDFRYVFEAEETRAAFLKDPERYAVQFGGICARMGLIREVYSQDPPVYGPPLRSGHPEIWAVHDGRIYLFSHMECHKAFLETPSRYLPTAPPALRVGDEAARRAMALLDKAVVAAGGGAAIDGVTSYTATLTQTVATPEGEAQSPVTVQWSRDGHGRIEMQRGPISKVAAAAPDGGFMRASRGQAVLVAEPMLAAQREFYVRTVRDHQDIIGVLQARTGDGFRAAVVPAPDGAAPGLEHVGVRFDRTVMTLGIDPASGRIRTMAFPGRVAHGYTGIRTLRLDDYRDVAGLVLPHKVDGRFDGKPDPEWSWTVTSIRLNEPIDPALFKSR